MIYLKQKMHPQSVMQLVSQGRWTLTESVPECTLRYHLGLDQPPQLHLTERTDWASAHEERYMCCTKPHLTQVDDLQCQGHNVLSP